MNKSKNDFWSFENHYSRIKKYMWENYGIDESNIDEELAKKEKAFKERIAKHTGSIVFDYKNNLVYYKDRPGIHDEVQAFKGHYINRSDNS